MQTLAGVVAARERANAIALTTLRSSFQRFQRFQLRKRLIGRRLAAFAGCIDELVEPAAQIDRHVLLDAHVTAFAGFRIVFDADDVAVGGADWRQNRFGNLGFANAGRIVQVGLHKGDEFGLIIGGKYVEALASLIARYAARKAAAGGQRKHGEDDGEQHGPAQRAVKSNHVADAARSSPIKPLISQLRMQVNLATPPPVERYFERLSAMVTDSTLLPGELITSDCLSPCVFTDRSAVKVSPSARTSI